MCWGSHRLAIARWGGAGVELEGALEAVWMELLTAEAPVVGAQQAADGANTDLELAEADQAAWEWPATDKIKLNTSFWYLPLRQESSLEKV